MSARAMFTAFSHIQSTKMAPCSKLVLLALANRHNQETGRCDPSLTRIAADMRISERAVRVGLRELEKLGIISTVQRQARTGRGKRNLTNRYRIRGGAEFAGRMGQNLPPKLKDNPPSAFDDLAMVLDDVAETFADAGAFGNRRDIAEKGGS